MTSLCSSCIILSTSSGLCSIQQAGRQVVRRTGASDAQRSANLNRCGQRRLAPPWHGLRERLHMQHEAYV